MVETNEHFSTSFSSDETVARYLTCEGVDQQSEAVRCNVQKGSCSYLSNYYTAFYEFDGLIKLRRIEFLCDSIIAENPLLMIHFINSNYKRFTVNLSEKHCVIDNIETWVFQSGIGLQVEVTQGMIRKPNVTLLFEVEKDGRSQVQRDKKVFR